MSSKAITMRKIKEVLRLRFECHLSFNAIARALELSKGAVAKYAALAQAAQLDWQTIESLDEAQLAKRLLPPEAMVPGQSQFAPIDFILVHQEMKKKKPHLAIALGRVLRGGHSKAVWLYEFLRSLHCFYQNP